MCTSPCDNCHINGCLTCKGNRYIDGVECLCPNDGEAIDKSNFCHSCKDVLLSIRLSKELTVIDVEFS